MQKRVFNWLSFAVLWLLIAFLGDDPGPDDDDDPEGDCWSFHQCYDSQWGYCILRAGHSGSHFCYKCNSYFDDSDD